MCRLPRHWLPGDFPQKTHCKPLNPDSAIEITRNQRRQLILVPDSYFHDFSLRGTDTIVTAARETAERFMNLVDSADVFWNCSTRFSDGYRYGLDAEVGISTNKIHARGPVGLDGLLIYKWKLYGKGQIVADYTGPNARKFTHKKLR